jgi:glycosyltransferase involved in cell wall biosynthesis
MAVDEDNIRTEHSMLRVCICTGLWLGSHHGIDVFLVDRSTQKSLSALIFDGDKYYAMINGRAYERHYPFYFRSLLPGIMKFVQEAIRHWIGFLTRTVVSEVIYPTIFDPYLFVKLFFVCKRERIDLIQCEFPSTALSAHIARKIFGIPLVYDAHNIESERLAKMPNVARLHMVVVKQIEAMACNICDSIFAVSGDDKARLVSWGIPESKITVIPNSVEVDKFSPIIDGSKVKDKYDLWNSIVLIFHGLLSYPPNREAAEILLNLFPNLLKKQSSVYLLLVGKNPPKTSNPKVITTGFVEHIPEYIAAADLAVVPLLSGGGTKIKILEYMACGKAIVSTTKGAEGLNLQNGRDILVTEHPGSEFIDLILKLIKDDALRKEIGTNARKRIELSYDWEKNAKKAVHIYNDTVLSWKPR